MKIICIFVCFTMLWYIPFSQIGRITDNLRTKKSVDRDTVPSIDSSNRGRLQAILDEFTDTLIVKGDEYKITHFYAVSNDIKKRMLLAAPDEVFDKKINQYSSLIFEEGNGHSFNIATIPLTHIIYLKKMGVIIGLSKIVASPYHIVIYSKDGELLCKRTLKNLELKLSKKELSDQLKMYPALSKCLEQNFIIKENENYYIELTSCVINILGRDSLLKMNKLVSSQYFPLMGSSIDAGLFSKYYHSFSDSDPLHDLVMIGTVPYLLILNSEEGRQVNIPLITKALCEAK